jgi:hypothetical protein
MQYAAPAYEPTMAADQQASASDTMLGRYNPREQRFDEQQQCVKAMGASVTSLAGLSEIGMGLAWS